MTRIPLPPAAPLLHPQRQRELIEQAAGMNTRQVAAAAPEVMPARHTLRAEAPDRYPLKMSIDQECEQGLRLLKDLLSHLDPCMSWGPGGALGARGGGAARPARRRSRAAAARCRQRGRVTAAGAEQDPRRRGGG